MSIASEITRLQTAKADIKDSIEAKGVTVPSNASIDTYYDYIDQIPSGGGGGIEIDPSPEGATNYKYNECSLSSYSTTSKYNKYTFSSGLELPIKWVKTTDGVELVDGTYKLYNGGGRFTNAEFVISTTNKGKVLTFNYLNTADYGLPMCTINAIGTYYGKRIYICIDTDRATFCTFQSGGVYLYAETTGTITAGSDSGYQTSSSIISRTDTLDPTTFGGYLLHNIYSVNTTNKVAYFTIVVID